MTKATVEKIKRKKQDYRNTRARRVEHTDWYQVLVGFTCQHCGAEVSSNPAASGVVNRNHCPYCLWSKHVDLNQSGDRLNACKEGMRPIGLTFKRVKNKYGSTLGELQVIHCCTGCGGYAINRIAADDDAELLWQLFEDGLRFSAERLAALARIEIEPAGEAQKAVVYQRLFGFLEN